MRVYLAASFSQKERIKLLTAQLQELGLVCTNEWQDEPKSAPVESWPDFANRDRASVDRADILIVLTDRQSTTGGYHWETGYAYGRGKIILIVGKRENFFHYLYDTERVVDWKGAKRWLVARAEKMIKES